MNRYITGIFFMINVMMFSQVGIKTTTPHSSADLELGSTNKTLYLNRVANLQTDIANPQQGMMVYDTTNKCVKVYGGNPAAWSACLTGDVVNPVPSPSQTKLSTSDATIKRAFSQPITTQSKLTVSMSGT